MPKLITVTALRFIVETKIKMPSQSTPWAQRYQGYLLASHVSFESHKLLTQYFHLNKSPATLV
jgi:hypothetical protein